MREGTAETDMHGNTAARNGTGHQRPSGTLPDEVAGRRRHRKPTSVLLALALVVGVLVVEFAHNPVSAEVTGLPAGFEDRVVFSGLDNPTVIQFGPDGRVWVGEKSGLIKVFDNLNDTTPTVFADLRTEVHNWWDRGLLGLVLDPQFPTRPYVYVQYSYDKQPGVASVPRWGVPGETEDYCEGDPEGGTAVGCVVSGRVSRLTVSGGGSGNTMTGTENVLVEDWCAQFPSHSIGTIAFGPDGYLYAAGGDGASFTLVDYGQRGDGTNGIPFNACNDQDGGTLNGEGGALRAQSVRTAAAANGKTSLDGAMIRIDPDTGAAAPGNPLAARANANERRVIGYGLRNPFRFAFRPNPDGSLSDDMWIGDVGWNDTESIFRLSVGAGSLPNFGWPCYEGGLANPGYQGANLGMCNTLDGASVVQPRFRYDHHSDIVPGDGCTTGDGGSSITGLAFYTGTSYPSLYQGGLFFTDYNRKCLWFMKKGSDGLPDPNQVSRFAVLGQHDSSTSQSDGGAVDVVPGPGGDLFWVDLFGGKIHRITYGSGNTAPTARISANPTHGQAPLTVNFDGSSSSDPENTALSYEWDLDGNGSFETSGATPTHIYPTPGPVTVTLRVTDAGSPARSATAQITVSPGASPPAAVIDTPTAGTTWRVGSRFDFSGHAVGGQAPVRLDWKVRFLTCITAADCVPRQVVPFNDTATGSYTAPDWGGAGSNVLEFQLTATDAGGLTATSSLRLQPQLATLRLLSSPGLGRKVSLDSEEVTTPYEQIFIVGSRHSLNVSAAQADFYNWSDGLPTSHEVTVQPWGTEVTANFVAPPAPPATGFAALPRATQVAIINFLAWVNWMRFIEFCRAVLKAQAAKKARRR